MRIFDPPSVKALYKQAGFFGDAVGRAATGLSDPALADEMLQSESQRSQLRTLYEAAAKEVGTKKATKAAVNGARMPAEVSCDMAKISRRPAVDTAERVVREILGV
jgi:hypothetical protein